MPSARRASTSRPEALRSTIACTSSTSYRLTPSRSRQSGSMSRGTARSITSSGRFLRSSITTSSSPRSIRWWGESVAETTMSARSSWAGSSSILTAVPPKRSASPIARL